MMFFSMCCLADEGGADPATVQSITATQEEEQRPSGVGSRTFFADEVPVAATDSAPKVEEKLKENTPPRSYPPADNDTIATGRLKTELAEKEERHQYSEQEKPLKKIHAGYDNVTEDDILDVLAAYHHDQDRPVEQIQPAVPVERTGSMETQFDEDTGNRKRPPLKDYEVCVQKLNSSSSFGITFDMSDARFPTVLSIVPGSLVDQWNSRQTDGAPRVEVGHALISVNGKVHHDGATLVRELRGEGQMKVMFRIPSKHEITLYKEGRKLDLKMRLGQLCLVVHSSSGLAAATGVRTHDRIYSVNDMEKNPRELFELINQSEVVKLGLQSFID
eukprot:TRINITY_DN253_c0_g1_i1.p1 TRINITY_DN253_c0_g1~~TRINITY_DN253_c0_g1_i1.p1  ORF type:complete len:345 (-),score=67.87 TRINITY_DN253_c0_g1_i1:101-1096(-)